MQVGWLRGLILGRMLVCAGLSGCASRIPPKELVQARKAYKEAEGGLAPKLTPAELDTAEKALRKAEAAFDDGEDAMTVDLAYIAERKALVAASAARTENANRLRLKASDSYQELTESHLKKSKKQLEAERREAQQTKKALEEERKARKAAEKRADAALASLAEVAKVKEESRGVVITLSGAVLFATNQSKLLPIAEAKLDEVARALKDQGPREIIVEGHTDSRGSAAKNQRLSEERAQAVRTYLVSQGVPSNTIRAMGYGKERPIADNNTTEGRANNRRVEIVVKK